MRRAQYPGAQVKVSINLDGTGKAKFDIGVPFLEHMLDQIAVTA